MNPAVAGVIGAIAFEGVRQSISWAMFAVRTHQMHQRTNALAKSFFEHVRRVEQQNQEEAH